ncbi:MAG: metal-binding protein [Lachnospiraceae bacterium]|nr:metal-binding protein [Lachnospiraceae bacterium]
MENSYKFFENKACAYYPCHEKTECINCLFCYCPLYHLEHCPGNYKKISWKGVEVKSCEDGTFPHEPENYETVIKILSGTMGK